MTSIRTKQKLVAQEVLYDFPLPEGNQKIVKVTEQGANNLHHVVTEDGEKFLVSMPTKFRNWIYIKQGSFVIIEPIAEGKKVKGEIISILYPEQIKYIDENGLWPTCFSDAVKRKGPETAYLDEDLLPPSSDEEDLDDEESDTEEEVSGVGSSEEAAPDEKAKANSWNKGLHF